MHFAGMLAFSLPIAITYEISGALESPLVAISVTAFA
jgi:NO-binding membrane sensor protein with MHYT domain